MIKLVIADETGATTVVPFVREEISIGRAEGNTIRLTERNISRKHAQLKRVGESHVIADLDSYNGVVLNGQRIDGESPVNPGDYIQIGDYYIAVQSDKEEEAVSSGKEEKGAEAAPAPSVTKPARLVMMTEPAAGAEYPLSKEKPTRIGRLESLDLPVIHRSVSREHASVKPENGSFRVVDTDSVNGIRVNGIKIKETLLNPGDVIEMGEVVFRYVAEGQSYLFDSVEAAKYARRSGPLSPKNLRIAAGIAGAALVLIVVLKWTRSQDTTVVTSLDTGQSSGASKQQVSTAEANEAYSRYLAYCKDAVAGERYAEAIAHAAKALEIKPSDSSARECKNTAQKQHQQEQIFVRGKAVFERGDMLGAYREFERLDGNSSFRKRPEVAEAANKVARDRIERARSLVGSSDPRKAVLLADSVLRIPDALPELHTAAREIKSQAEQREQALAASAAATPSRRAARSVSASVRHKAVSDQKGRQPSAVPSSGLTPIQVAGACLAQGDNRCVIRALEGKARTAQELGLLIETYRSMGNTPRALKNMRLYLKRFPGGPRAPVYQKILEHSGR
jgi:pSer/pThr/pTyr-binding forkhead associated (FHA) protein